MDPINTPADVAQKRMFVWRDAQGVRHDITRMDIDYLFRIVCMIWNNARPDAPTRADFKRYSFGRDYSPAYLAEALREMLFVLYDRYDDLGVRQQETLDYILKMANNPSSQS